jgi:hypothetical protein
MYPTTTVMIASLEGSMTTDVDGGCKAPVTGAAAVLEASTTTGDRHIRAPHRGQ